MCVNVCERGVFYSLLVDEVILHSDLMLVAPLGFAVILCVFNEVILPANESCCL